MNGLFRVVLEAVSPRPEIDLSPIVGGRAEFAFVASRDRRFRGLVSDMTFVRVADDALGLATYELVIVPTLWRLTQRRGNRLFQHASIPDVVKQILDEWKIVHEWEVDGAAYPNLELRTQYGESDFDFVSRLLEEAGISLWMRDGGDDDATVVLGDAPHTNPTRAGQPLAFVDEVAQAFAGRAEFVTSVRLREVSKPGRLTLRDHDPSRPRASLFASAESLREAERAHEQFGFVPGVGLHETRQSAGTTMTPVADDLGVSRHTDVRVKDEARRRLDALHVDRRVVTLETSVNDLSPGVVFQIAGHPREDLSGDNRFLVVCARFEGEIAKAAEWRFSTTAVNGRDPYRPARRTAKPRMYGLQTAVVVGDGASSGPRTKLQGAVGALSATAMDEGLTAAKLVDEDIYVDEHGRVRVQFPWDREHDFGSDSSTWMRVSQGWAGGRLRHVRDPAGGSRGARRLRGRRSRLPNGGGPRPQRARAGALLAAREQDGEHLEERKLPGR